MNLVGSYIFSVHTYLSKKGIHGIKFEFNMHHIEMGVIICRSKTLVQISNFEYLMQLNTLAGRSYNDITQVDFSPNFFMLYGEIL